MATLGLFVSAIPFLGGQDLPYSNGSDGSDGALDIPYHIQYRENFSIAYDAVRDETLIFGGHWSSTYYPELWALDADTGAWTKKEPATFVSGRRDHSMVFDPVNNVVLMFGGYRADGTLLNDMWSWDGNDWTQLTPATVPTARYDHVMAVRPSDGAILLFGGYNGSSHLQDTWMWNGTTWTQLTPVTTPNANSSSYNTMVYHETLDGWLLYSENQRTTWLFDGTNWSQITTADSPNTGARPAMVYDAARDEVVHFDGDSLYAQTWVFTGGEWAQRSPASSPNRRRGHGIVYDSTREIVITTLGDYDGYYLYTADAWSTSRQRFTTYTWDGVTWSYLSGWLYRFDLNEPDADADGKYEFTTINVPSWVQVRFTKDAANSPVVWYASGDVNIDGYLLVDGRDAPDNTGVGLFADGGPGGGNGGTGGIRFDVSGSYAGVPGTGQGGGAPGVAADQYGSGGTFFGVYGNPMQQPLLGGSGGGGGGSRSNGNGGNGGGGGGAIQIDSSRDITVNGIINADGGRYEHTGGSYGGVGSGGGILLRADRVLGSGSLWARGGRSQSGEVGGRIRVEAFYRPLAVNASPAPSATAPVESLVTGDTPTLMVVSVDGVGVVDPPSGNPNTPDVVFAEAGTVSVVVQGTNIPEGTAVTLRITGSGTIIELPESGDAAVTLDGSGMATFTATVPAGVGTIQAFATFTP